jgi:DNA-binding transcriptional MerR regulator
MYSISEVARRIGVKRFHISYAHQMGYLPDVARFQGSRIYTEGDVKMVEAYFLAKGGKSQRFTGGGGEVE